MENIIFNKPRIWLTACLFFVFSFGCENDPNDSGTSVSQGMEAFLKSLNSEQLQAMQDNPDFKQYLLRHDVSQQSQEFILQLIDIVIEHGGSFRFDGSVNVNNALVFWDVTRFGKFLGDVDVGGSDFGLETNDIHRIAHCKVHLLGFFGGVQINIAQNDMPYALQSVSSDRYGFIAAFGWTQTSASHSVTTDTATVLLRGKISYNCVLRGNGMVWSTRKKYKIVIDKNTAAILSAVKMD